MASSTLSHTLQLLLALIVPLSASAQGASAFLGDWRLVSFIQSDSLGGGQHDVWGPKPLGIIHYSATGMMAAQLYDERRRLLPVPDYRNATPADAREAFAAMTSYFGTYAIDTVAKTVTHTVQGAWAPNWIGRKLVRSYRFISHDRIELRVTIALDGRPTSFGTLLVWERIPERARGTP